VNCQDPLIWPVWSSWAFHCALVFPHGCAQCALTQSNSPGLDWVTVTSGTVSVLTHESACAVLSGATKTPAASPAKVSADPSIAPARHPGRDGRRLVSIEVIIMSPFVIAGGAPPPHAASVRRLETRKKGRPPHRDVMLTRTGDVKVMDFGIARPLPAARSR